jgi:hypothetical protein
MGGLYGLGSIDSDLTRRVNLLNSIQSFQSELLHAVSGLSRGNAAFDNATAYADTMAKMLQQLGDSQVEVGIRAGGNAGKEATKMMNSYDKLLASRRAMWDADLKDPSGGASMELANKERLAAQAKTVQAAENVAFWEKVTDINNPFSPVGILSTVKKYAIWFLIIGGVVLAAPVLFPAVGKLIGHARRPESSPSKVAANRRRRC